MRALAAMVAVLVVLAGGTVRAQDGRTTSRSLLEAGSGKLPIYFIENRSVYPDDVAYSIQGSDKTLFFARDGMTFRLKGEDRGWVVKLEFVGANPDVAPQGEEPQQAVISYFRGPEKDWKTGLKTFSKIVYRDLWPGIDLVYRLEATQLKYEFRVHPGADPTRIRMRYRGGTVAASPGGGITVRTPAGTFEDQAPVAWQEDLQGRTSVEVRFEETGHAQGEVSFSLGEYDRSRTLVIDPAVLLNCGFLGGVGSDTALAVALDPAGNIYVTGAATSSEASFPVTVGPYLTYRGKGAENFGDVFVAKLDPTATTLIYCGYIGGADDECGYAIAVDRSGAAYVAGDTGSDEKTFPVKAGPGLRYGGWTKDGFVAKVAPDGKSLVYCGYLGGTWNDHATGVSVDAYGWAYVVGCTKSDQLSFPVVVGPDLTFNTTFGGYDAFVAKLSPDGLFLAYCGYIGGQSETRAGGVAVDAAGNAYLTGYTLSDQTTFPVRIGPDLTYNGGLGDCFIAKVNPSGGSLVYCGYIGGMALEGPQTNVAVDATGSAYVVGATQSAELTFPVTVGPDLTFNGKEDLFVAKVRSDGAGLDYCGYIGGSDFDVGALKKGSVYFQGPSIAVDSQGAAHVVGGTLSDEQTFPITKNTLSGHYAGPAPVPLTASGDAFVAKVHPTGARLEACGYIGGSGEDCGVGLALDASGNAVVVGYTESTEATFPVLAARDPTYNGSGDGFLARVAFCLLDTSGTPRIGSTVTLLLSATADGGLPYQVGTSLGTGPIPVGGKRWLDLSLDALLDVSVNGRIPTVFRDYGGFLNALGKGQAAIDIPNSPVLIGVTVYSAFVTLGQGSPLGIKSVSNTIALTITK